METITLKYNKNNSLAKKTVNYILSLGVFSVEEKQIQKGIEKSLADIKNGRVYKAKSVKDLMSKI